MATRMDRQEIIDMTIDMKLALDRKLLLGNPVYEKCEACPDVYPKAYQLITQKYCIPCHLEKSYGIVLEEGIENVPALMTKIPVGMHEAIETPRGGLY